MSVLVGFRVGITTNKTMNKLTIENIKGALVSGVLMAVLATIAYVSQTGDIFAIDVKVLANIFVTALLTSVTSIVKNLLTNNAGEFGGIVRVK